jgi:CheY-like chemotaxis protein
VDGGNVLFLRYPVFYSAKLWGFVSLTVDFEKLVESFKLETHYPGLVFAFSDGEHYFVGAGAAFSAGGASAPVKLPGADWRVHALPVRGWATADPFLYILLVAGLTGAVLLFVVFFSRAPKTLQSTSGMRVEAEPTELAFEPLNGSPINSPVPVPVQAPVQEQAPVQAPVEDQDQVAPTSPVPVPTPEKKSTPTPIILPMRNGKEVKFKGPAVKGQLYMPEFFFQDEELDELLDAPRPEPLPVPRSEPRPEPKLEPKPEIRQPAFERPSRPKPVELRRQEFLFSLEEEKPDAAMSILVVDDSGANRDIMGRMLSLRGYKADFAASGQEALTLCASKRYAIIFMDCFMPDMDGYRTTSLLRVGQQGKGASVIGMSARVGDQELERCRQSGMDGLMAKPFTLKDLLAHIEKN